jgi:hypothetical protein
LLYSVVAGALRSIPVTPPIFVPLVGAFVRWKEPPRSAWDEAVLAAGGPLAGVLASFLAGVFAVVHESPILWYAAVRGLILHLFNLLPVIPLDGGRILRGVSPWFPYLTVPVALFMFLTSGGLATGVLLAHTLKSRAWETPASYHDVPIRHRLLAGLLYVGLLGICLAGVLLSGVTLDLLVGLYSRRGNGLLEPSNAAWVSLVASLVYFAYQLRSRSRAEAPASSQGAQADDDREAVCERP